MNITEFLEARIAEDEKDAIDRVVLRTEDHRRLTMDDAEKIHAECAAKRAIMGLHRRDNDVQRMAYGDIYPCTECGDIDDSPVEFPCATVRALAAVYASHPDYDPAWSPNAR